MKQAIRVRTAKFLFTQAAIMVGIMAAFFLLAGAFFVRNAVSWNARNIENDLKVFSEQAARSGEVPKRGDLGLYTFFIINTEGRYLLPRLPHSDDSERLWQESESKILYEMQKRHDGWSYYPERKRWDFRAGQHILRYMLVPQMGWIVAAEGYMPGTMDILKEVFSPALFIGMFLIVLAAVVFMMLNANWHVYRVTRAILRSQDNNFIDAESIVPPVKKLSLPGTAKLEGKFPVTGPVAEGVIGGALRRTPPRGPVMPVLPVVPEAREVEVTPEPPVAPAPPPAPRPALFPSRTSVQTSRRGEALGSVSIDTSELRSTVLRKAIEELRESRK